MDPPSLDASVAKETDPIAYWLVNPGTGEKSALVVPKGHMPFEISPEV